MTVTKIYRRFTHKMPTENGGHKQNYVNVTLCIRISDSGVISFSIYAS